jgi:DNA-binding FadR family transcriptional regulator
LDHSISRLHRIVLTELLAEIVAGSPPPGARLPKEVELAERFEVSRGVVRESLRGLEERRVIKVRHGAGATVRPMGDWNVIDPDILSAVISGGSSLDVLCEFLECRRIIEVECAGLAALRAGPDDFAAISAAYERMEAYAELGDSAPVYEERYHEANVDFHAAIIAASHNRVLSRLTEPVQRAYLLARRATAHRESRLNRTLPEHLAILEAIADRDADRAREAMNTHLNSVFDHVVELGAAQDQALAVRDRGSARG